MRHGRAGTQRRLDLPKSLSSPYLVARPLIVVFVRKTMQVALIVSARDMTGSERKLYEKR